MSEPFLVFQSFADPGLAAELTDKLREQDIAFKIEDASSPLDPVIIGSTLAADIRIKLRQQDFQRARAALEGYYTQVIDGIEADYYLFEFTDQELYDLLAKPDEWGYFDYLLAQKILKDKGKEVGAGELELFKSKRMAEISQPVELGGFWLTVGYALAFLLCPIGIFFGSAVMSLKKTLPDGSRVYSYTERDRKHAKTILIVASILTVAWLMVVVTGERHD